MLCWSLIFLTLACLCGLLAVAGAFGILFWKWLAAIFVITFVVAWYREHKLE